MAKPRDPSSLPKGWEYGLTGEGMTGPASPRPSAPRTPQGLLSYIETLGRQANDNLPSAPRHAPILAQASTPGPASTSLDEVHRVENRWPVIDAGNERARRRSILEDSPTLFSMEENANANGDAPWNRAPKMGAAAVLKFNDEIEKEAARAGVDPDLLRAVMYVEVSQGGGYGYPAEQVGLADSILPMNIRTSLWRSLLPEGQPKWRLVGAGRTPPRLVDEGAKVFDDPRLNIRAGALLLKRIQERVMEPSIRNAATLYNSLGQRQVTNYGAQVEQAYQNREWEQTDAGPIGRGPRMKWPQKR
jgi:hypothetical protein